MIGQVELGFHFPVILSWVGPFHLHVPLPERVPPLQCLLLCAVVCVSIYSLDPIPSLILESPLPLAQRLACGQDERTGE